MEESQQPQPQPQQLKRQQQQQREERPRRIVLPPPDDERRPLLSRLYTDNGDNGEGTFSCVSNPHSHLPVYTTIHRIRRDVMTVVEDYLSLEQLRDVRINITVVTPLVDKFYQLNDLSISKLKVSVYSS